MVLKTQTPGQARDPAEEKAPPTYTSDVLGLMVILLTDIVSPASAGGWIVKEEVRRLYEIKPFTAPPLTVPVSAPPANRVSPCTANARIAESLDSDEPTPVTVSEFEPLIKARLLTSDPFDPRAVKCPPRTVILRPPFS